MTIFLGGFFRCLHANLDAASLLHLELQARCLERLSTDRLDAHDEFNSPA